MNTVEFAIITVVKGDLPGLIKTREAIETQTYKNWKHVVIYGGNDPEAIKYIQGLNPQNTIYKVELDSGIYNAMNKGWKLSPENCYIYFLNARDVFAGHRDWRRGDRWCAGRVLHDLWHRHQKAFAL